MVSLLLPSDGLHSDKVESVWFEKLTSVPIGGGAIVDWSQKIGLLLHPLFLDLIIVLGINFRQFKFCFIQIGISFFVFLNFLLDTEFQRIFCSELVLELLVIKQARTTFELRQPLWTYGCVDFVSCLNFILNLRQIAILTALITRSQILSSFLLYLLLDLLFPLLEEGIIDLPNEFLFHLPLHLRWRCQLVLLYLVAYSLLGWRTHRMLSGYYWGLLVLVCFVN